jgi:hypothetical protein
MVGDEGKEVFALAPTSTATTEPAAPAAPAHHMTPDAVRASRRSINELGWAPLDRVPEWGVVELVERAHRLHAATIIELLEARLAPMEEDSDHMFGGRPGREVARQVTDDLKERGIDGINVTATHPSMDEATWSDTGARFYVSIVEGILYNSLHESIVAGGVGTVPLPPCPPTLADILWPFEEDRHNVGPAEGSARVTELGWTCVPPGSDPQALHADIVAEEDPLDSPRWVGRGRYQHLIWKEFRCDGEGEGAGAGGGCGGGGEGEGKEGKEKGEGEGEEKGGGAGKVRAATAPNCTTNIVPGGFTEGASRAIHYKRIVIGRARALLFDSEMLHRGGSTREKTEWTTSCTVQICSRSGWPSLGRAGRCETGLLKMTIPLGTTPASPRSALEGAGGGAGAAVRAGTGAAVGGSVGGCVPAFASASLGDTGGGDAGALLAKKQGTMPGTKHGREGEGGRLEGKGLERGAPGTAGNRKSGGGIPGGQRHHGRSGWEAEIAAVDRHFKGGHGTNNLASHARLRTHGYLALDHGIPWQWDLVDFVEEMHERYAEAVSKALAALEGTWRHIDSDVDDGGSDGGGSGSGRSDGAVSEKGFSFSMPPTMGVEMGAAEMVSKGMLGAASDDSRMLGLAGRGGGGEGRPQRQPRANERPGEEAAALVSKQFKKEGLAVYVQTEHLYNIQCSEIFTLRNEKLHTEA